MNIIAPVGIPGIEGFQNPAKPDSKLESSLNRIPSQDQPDRSRVEDTFTLTTDFASLKKNSSISVGEARQKTGMMQAVGEYIRQVLRDLETADGLVDISSESICPVVRQVRQEKNANANNRFTDMGKAGLALEKLNDEIHSATGEQCREIISSQTNAFNKGNISRLLG